MPNIKKNKVAQGLYRIVYLITQNIIEEQL